jgi:hypothetical protein
MEELKEGINSRLKRLDIGVSLSVRVVRAALTMQEKYLKAKQKSGKNTKCRNEMIAAPKIRETICKLLGISSRSFCYVLHSYLENQTIYNTGVDGNGRSGNTSPKSKRVPQTKRVQVLVREQCQKFRDVGHIRRSYVIIFI